MLAAFFGPAAAIGTAAVATRLMAVCDTGIDGPANNFFLLTLLLPVLILFDFAVFWAVFLYTFRAAATEMWRAAAGVVAVLAGLVPLVLTAWALLAWGIPPEALDLPTCPENVPAWPFWLPL